MTYDRYANRSAQSISSGCVAPMTCPTNSLSFANPGGAQTNRVDGWCYDASGNLLAKSSPPCNSPTFQYDAENRLVADTAAGSTYLYDGNGIRVQKTVGGASTVFLWSGSRDVAEYDNDAAPASPSREFIWADALPGPGLVASITAGTPPTTTYFHSDHLSNRLTTDSSGNKLGEQGHYPFGESWYSNNGSGEWVLTTYQRDGESGLDYALARYYDSTAARFCSADPVGGQPADPQSWNRYAYVENDPINLTDPSGRSFWKWLGSVDFPGERRARSGKQVPHPAKGAGIRDDSCADVLSNSGMSTEPSGFLISLQLP